MAYAIVAFCVFLFSGTAFAYLVGATAVIAFLMTGYPQYIAILPQRIFAQLDVFAFMAMPLFILTGELMNRAGVMGSLIDFAMALLGRFKGGLGHVILPGLLLACLLFGFNAWIAHRDDHPGGRTIDIPPLFASFKRAWPALSIPIIILGSIVFGLTTPTEGAALAVIAAILVGWSMGGMSWKVLYSAVEATARLTGSIFIIICSIAVLSYLAGLLGWPQLLAGWIASMGLTGNNYLLLLIFVLLVAGMFMDTPVALTLLVPLLVPTALLQGFNPVHLGIMVCFNLCIGLITPPFGKCLIVVSGIAKINYWNLAKATLPFIGIQLVILLIIAFFPNISLWLPRLFGFNVL